MLAMGLFLWMKSRNKFMTMLMIVLSVGAIGAIMPQEWYARMQTTERYQEDDSALGRINAWHTAFNVAKARITGGGIEMFRPSVFREYAPEPGRVHDVHSVYFEMMGEHGFIGFGLFMSIMALTWMKGSSIIRRTKRIPEMKWAQDLAAMTQVSMIGYATCGAFLGLSYFDYYWHLVAIMVILNHLVTQQIAKPASQASPVIFKQGFNSGPERSMTVSRLPPSPAQAHLPMPSR
jgi:probable O-glycosylation ligase (exosortase A-associated)